MDGEDSLGGGELDLQASDLVEQGRGPQGLGQAAQLAQLTRTRHQLTRVHKVDQSRHNLPKILRFFFIHT